MGVFRDFLENSTSSYGGGRDIEKLSTNAAELLQHGVRSMIAEGQDPREVYEKAFPIFGENFLIEAGIVEIVNGEEA